MSIVAACRCGQRFQARPELAGRTLPCPACGQMLQVPAAQPVTSSSTAAPAMPRPAPPPTPSPLRSPAALPKPQHVNAASPKQPSSNKGLVIGLAVGGAVIALGLVTLVGLVVLLPAVKAARNAAREAQARNEARAGGTSFPAGSTSNSSDWYSYSSPTGGYAILFPSMPRPKTQIVPTPVGVITQQTQLVDQGNVAYMSTHHDMPAVAVNASSLDSILDEAADGAVTNVQGRLISKTTIAVGAYSGRDVTFEGEKAGRAFTAHARIVLAGPRLYTLLYMGDKGHLNDVNKRRFFDSFAISYQPTASPAGVGEVLNTVTGDMAWRQNMYKEIKRIEQQTAPDRRIEIMEKNGLAGAAENLKRLAESNRKTSMMALAVQHNTTVEVLEQVQSEGDAAGWPAE